MTTPVGLRERKKEATRQALHEAALRLAIERGLDAVTIEVIADAATVSRRTFSNYFSSKEEALLYGERRRVHQLLDAVRSRPRDETPWLALTRSVEDLPLPASDRDPAWAAPARLIRSHPSLLAQQVATYAAMERDLESEIATRLPDSATSPMRARLLAAAFLGAIRVATHTWFDQPPGTSLTALIHEALAETGARFA
ncbi:TetR family transcriptional regulator [Acrocarpospora phusangensis]|uniref:TetR family transcriptional regulator n=1 Tax=Acrocarpospora phusangensis TaxID=1070424 RepID=A0A919UPW8_9ACTN|nr:TetR/AcrR family transcriptional regulator [Acrocarpospora phusangensis]GIH25788.1 TetR family transcriptional regulator [Acrocarpospora phusangensis]